MVGKKRLGKVLVGFVLYSAILLLACKTAENYSRGYLWNQFQENSRISSVFKDRSFQKNPFVVDGLSFQEKDDLNLSLFLSGENPGLTLSFPVYITRLGIIHFRLKGSPHSIDFSITPTNLPDWKPGEKVHVRLSRTESTFEMKVHGKILESFPLSGHKFDNFRIDSIQSDFVIGTLEILTADTGDDNFFPLGADRNQRNLYYFLAIFIGLLLSIAQNFLSIFQAQKNRFQSTGGFALSLLPFVFIFTVPMSYTPGDLLGAAIILYFFTILITGFWILKPLRSRPGFIILLAFSLGGWAIAWFGSFPAPVAAVGLLMAGCLAFILAKSQEGRAIPRNPYDLSQSAKCFVPVALGVPYWLFGGNDAIALVATFSWISAAMIFVRTIAIRRHVKWFTPILLSLAALVVFSAESMVRQSSLEPAMREKNTGKNFVSDGLLFYIPGDLFDNNDAFQLRKLQFRSGPTPKEPPKNVFRIMTLGGSTTYGDGIDSNEQTYSGILQKCLNDGRKTKQFEVINSGVKGYNLFQLLTLFRIYGVQYNPHLLIIYLNNLDARLVKGPYTHRELWEMVNAGQSAPFAQPSDNVGKTEYKFMVPALQSTLGHLRLYNALVGLVREQKETSLSAIAERFDVVKDVNPISDYVINLTELIALCKQRSIKVILADEFYINYEPNPHQKTTLLRQEMKRQAIKHELGFIPINDILGLREDKSSFIFPHDSTHPSRKGHQAIAELMCDYLKGNEYYLETTLY